jgi:predicted Zn finger-like uncharacterized protein
VFTQCSKCETVFKLSAEVLRAAGGQVRCGKCGEVFNALAHLAEDPSVFTVDETEIDLEFRADSILESPAPMTPARRPPAGREDFTPPGVEIARLQILDWTESDSPNVPAAQFDDPAAEQLGETSMEFTLPPGELDRIFVETKTRARPPTSHSSSRAETRLPSPAPSAASSPAPSPAPPPLPPHPEDIEIFNAAPAETAPEASPAAAASGFEVSEDIRREMLSGLESSAAIEAPLTQGKTRRRERLSASPFAPAPKESARSLISWLIAAIASALLLIVQVVHQNRDWLAAHAPLGGTLRALYSTMGAPVSPPANLSAYQLRQWGVTGDPAGEGTLRVRASILNTAAQLEPYPLLRVTLANRFGGGIGTRDFEPSEYLGKPTAKLLAPGERVDATMDILDPGKSAEGFEIDVCLRGADRKVSCANDAAPALPKR